MDALLDKLVPLVIIFMLLRGILSTLFGRKKRRRLPDDFPQDEGDMELPQTGTEEESVSQAEKQLDLAAEFERRLKKTTEENAADKEATRQAQKNERVNPVRQDKQRVHRDDEEMHEGKGRVHRDGETITHDKGRVYYDPCGDYSYDEARMNADAAAFRARFVRQAEPNKQKVKLKHGALVNGFIMAQVLDKPRSLKAYGAEEQL